MIRVIYRWKVEPERSEQFLSAWRLATRAIHAETDGALGSFCLASVDEPSEFLTVALWRSERDWRGFIDEARNGPMAAIHKIAKLLSATPYRQLGDETVSSDR
jgi:heme-degrading monooxygenase HmoA